MEEIIILVIIFLLISVFAIISYVVYMLTKKNHYPQMKFSKFCNEKNNVLEVEKLINESIRDVNGWMWLATFFTSLYYLLNFWSITLMMINVFISIFETNEYKSCTTFLTLGSLMFTFIDLWLNTKEKSVSFNKHWFNTSAITKQYVAKFANVQTFDELCILAIEFNDLIFKENIKIQLL